MAASGGPAQFQAKVTSPFVTRLLAGAVNTGALSIVAGAAVGRRVGVARAGVLVGRGVGVSVGVAVGADVAVAVAVAVGVKVGGAAVGGEV